MANLFNDLMEQMNNRSLPLNGSSEEIANRMVEAIKKYDKLELSDDEISQLEAAAGYFDDDEEEDYDSYPKDKIW